jgi:hypothetical protein
MKKLNQVLIMASVATALSLGTGQLAAQDQPQRQGRGNFDPEQMRQRVMERMREQFEVKDDAEWKIVEGKIQKVMDARRAAGGGFGGGFGVFGGPGGGRRGPDAQGGDGAPPRGNRGGFGGEPNPDVEALQKAIEAKAPADEIKAKLAKVRESRKAGEAKLEAAQEDLKKILTVRQEAVAVMAGLLK